MFLISQSAEPDPRIEKCLVETIQELQEDVAILGPRGDYWKGKFYRTRIAKKRLEKQLLHLGEDERLFEGQKAHRKWLTELNSRQAARIRELTRECDQLKRLCKK